MKVQSSLYMKNIAPTMTQVKMAPSDSNNFEINGDYKHCMSQTFHSPQMKFENTPCYRLDRRLGAARRAPEPAGSKFGQSHLLYQIQILFQQEQRKQWTFFRLHHNLRRILSAITKKNGATYCHYQGDNHHTQQLLLQKHNTLTTLYFWGIATYSKQW